MSNATVDALLDNLRAKLPSVGDDLIKLELYNTIDELCREALRVAAPVDVDADPADWLDSSLWVEHYQVLLHGTMYRMYSQLKKPWSDPDLAKSRFDLYQTYLDLARTEASAGQTTAYARLIAAVRVLVPFARDAALDLELFGVVNTVRLEALGLDELDGTDPDQANWLTAAQYGEAYQALYHGLLGRMYSQIGKSWANPDAAQQHTARFLSEIDALRTEQSDAPATAYDRLVHAIKVQLPFVRDEAVKLELYNTINKIRLEALRTTALEGTETDPTDWLTTEQYSQAYNAIYHGTLARLYAQPSKPWADGTAVVLHETKYSAELDLIRGEEADAPATALDRLVGNLVIRLPGAREEVLKMEIFAVLDELFRTTNMWQESIPFDTVLNQKEYEIEPEEDVATIVRLMHVKNTNDLPVGAYFQMLDSTLVLFNDPPAAEEWSVTVALTVSEPTNAEGYPRYPYWVLDRYLDSIMDGVLGRMMSQISKPYYNERMSVYHLRRWRNLMAQVRSDVLHKHVNDAQAWNFPRGWR
jgi:hypothetical protein